MLPEARVNALGIEKIANSRHIYAMLSKRPQAEGKRISKVRERLRVIAHHPNGLPIIALIDSDPEFTSAEVLAAVRSVMKEQHSRRQSAVRR